MAHPTACQAIASARRKNDKVDARTVAQLCGPTCWARRGSLDVRFASFAWCCLTGPGHIAPVTHRDAGSLHERVDEPREELSALVAVTVALPDPFSGTSRSGILHPFTRALAPSPLQDHVPLVEEPH